MMLAYVYNIYDVTLSHNAILQKMLYMLYLPLTMKDSVGVSQEHSPAKYMQICKLNANMQNGCNLNKACHPGCYTKETP